VRRGITVEVGEEEVEEEEGVDGDHKQQW